MKNRKSHDYSDYEQYMNKRAGRKDNLLENNILEENETEGQVTKPANNSTNYAKL